MGARHSTTLNPNAAITTNISNTSSGGTNTSSAGGPNDEFSSHSMIELDPQLSQYYLVDRYLFPGSGRMMRTFRLKHKQNNSYVVVKLMWLSKDEIQFADQELQIETNKRQGGDNKNKSADTITTTTTNTTSSVERSLQVQQQELVRIQQALQGQAHVGPFIYWYIGPYRTYVPNNNNALKNLVRPIILLRPYFYTTLSDRLASRPFLTHVEKLWIVYQLLHAVHEMHTANVVHGFLTTENIGLSSWNWLMIIDIASYKAKTQLPDDDPSEYLYYYQELFNQQGSDSTPREKRCYIAPERFYTPNTSNNNTTDNNEEEQEQDDQDSQNTPKTDNKEGEKEVTVIKKKQQQQQPLTPAMDIFSVGCIIMETFLNGERAFDLGDLMEYRRRQQSSQQQQRSSQSQKSSSTTTTNTVLPQTLQQKLNKIEFSALRAACKHMLSLDPNQRLSAKEYLERLQASDLIPTKSFEILSKLMSEVTSTTCSNDDNNDRKKGRYPVQVVTPDARLAKAAAFYATIIYETMGVYDWNGKQYFEKALGTKSAKRLEEEYVSSADSDNGGGDIATQQETIHSKESFSATTITSTEEKKESDQDTLFAETEALLKKLEALSFDEDEVLSMAFQDPSNADNEDKSSNSAFDNVNKPKVSRSHMAQSSLLVYLQLVLSTVRHVQRPASKLVALQLMDRIGKYSNDEARLQRIVPVTVSLLHDQDSLVRASAIQVLTSTISVVDTFPPSDSKVFPQYIFKRVAHLVTDLSLVVRLAFAKSLAMLAETAHRFLDISHAVRLYEAVGGGGGGGSSATPVENERENSSRNVFGDDVAKLLDGAGGTSNNSKALKKIDSSVSDIGGAGKTLISSTYNSELGALHETISRWVVHITTDVSEHSSPAKRALLQDMPRLCTFFGLDGVMAFILPQILSFLNDRKDWQLRATLFEHLQSVCQFIGRAATEHFVLPILETALVDSQEIVIGRALKCLSELLRLGLLSRNVLLGRQGSSGTDEIPGLLKKYGALLLHPSSDIRLHAIITLNTLCEIVGSLDGEVFVVPIIRPYLRFQPSWHHLCSKEGMDRCLYPPWTREKFETELLKLIIATDSSPTAGQWTSIALQIKDGENDAAKGESDGSRTEDTSKHQNLSQKDSASDEHIVLFRSYLHMLARGRNYAAKMGLGNENTNQDIGNAIEGSMKLAQQIKFPRQDIPGPLARTLPNWYSQLLDFQESRNDGLPETTAIRSVSALGQVYGLSIMDQAVAPPATDGITAQEAIEILQSEESKSIEAALTGEWGSETCIDPTLTDTCLLLSKLSALQVPPLPPRLSEEHPTAAKADQSPRQQHPRAAGDPRESHVWKPKIDTVIATSRRAPDLGHIAPIVRLAVAHDQSFFVTGSHDGTCRVWEAGKAEKSNGVLESSLVYSVHNTSTGDKTARINDLAMLEGSHSVVSGASDGSVHVWRVDLVSSSTGIIADTNRDGRSVSGFTEIRKMNPLEGEVLAVNQYNAPGASVITFATQKGLVHSWDLRCAVEPYCLKTFPDTGYITSMAIGSDRNWAVVGTNRGFIALWDLRFQQIMKLWQHSRSTPINRLATSFVPPPQSWSGKGYANAEGRPFIFVASGPNECAMFDATTGHCSECFRTVEYGSRSPMARIEGVPQLSEIPLSTCARRKGMYTQSNPSSRLSDAVASYFRSVNCMVGSTGASDSSFLVTGGSDCRIRFWDFTVPSRCYVTSGTEPLQPRPSFERIDFDNKSRLMLCRQAPAPALGGVDSSRVPRKLFQGTRAIPQGHHDAITDLKFLKNNLVSCSRDGTVKIWR